MTAGRKRRLFLPIGALVVGSGVLVSVRGRRHHTATSLLLDATAPANPAALVLDDAPSPDAALGSPAGEAGAILDTAPTRLRRDTWPGKLVRLGFGLTLGLPAGAALGLALTAALLLLSPGWNHPAGGHVGSIATVDTQDLPPRDDVFAVTSADVSIAPAADTAVLGSIEQGESVRILGQDLDGAWVAISFPPNSDGLGWVQASALSSPRQPGATQASARLSPTKREADAYASAAPIEGSATSLEASAGARKGDDARLAALALATALGMTLLPAALSKLSDS